MSLALACTDWSLGINAAAKIPIITTTISISIRVKDFFVDIVLFDYVKRPVSKSDIAIHLRFAINS